MSPEAMAALHQRAFTVPRPWSAEEIAALLASPLVFVVATEGGFAMGRVVAGEAELLTIAVEPELQGRGIGRGLMADFLAEAAARGAESVFLEVAENNVSALALYRGVGFAEAGRRRGYYGGVDAVVMVRPGGSGANPP